MAQTRLLDDAGRTVTGDNQVPLLVDALDWQKLSPYRPSTGLITRALARYLTEDKDLTGHAAQPFARPQTIDDMVLNSRNDARRWLRSLVGGHVYARRVPQKCSAHTAITIGLLARNKTQPLIGEVGVVDSTLQVNVLSRGPGADNRATTVGQLLTIATSNYRGWWHDTYVHNVQVERDDDMAEEPTDGSDTWAWQWSMDMTVGHDTTSPIYPTDVLTARLEITKRSGGIIVLSAANSTIPEGLTLPSVHWFVRNAAGDQVLEYGGPPDAVATPGTVDGTNYEAAVSGLPTAGSAELYLTDSTGAVATAGGTWS